MATPTTWRRSERADDETATFTPFDLLDHYRGEAFLEEYGGASVFSQLLTPKTRALILDVLVGERGTALTAQEIADQREDLSVTGVNRHRDALIDFGVVMNAGKRGNATTYALATDHPVGQLLVMLDDLLQWGETPVTVDEAFISTDDQPSAITEWTDA